MVKPDFYGVLNGEEIQVILPQASEEYGPISHYFLIVVPDDERAPKHPDQLLTDEVRDHFFREMALTLFLYICSWLRLKGLSKSSKVNRMWLQSFRSGTFLTPSIWEMARPTTATSTESCREAGNIVFLCDL